MNFCCCIVCRTQIESTDDVVLGGTTHLYGSLHLVIHRRCRHRLSEEMVQNMLEPLIPQINRVLANHAAAGFDKQ